MIIVFSGSSGSGKSSLLKETSLLAYFKDKDVSIKKEDNFVLINLIKRYLGEKSFTNYNERKLLKKQEKGTKSKLFSLLVYLFYPLAVYIELLAEHIYYEIINKKKVLLRDRSAYDYLVTFKYNLNILNPTNEYLFINFPKPYLLFVLDIDVKTALERNKNIITGAITTQRSFHKLVTDEYRQLAKRNKLLLIDNIKISGASVKTIKKHILNKERLIKLRMVTISGTDGSGKTTLINLFSDYLERLNIKYKVTHFYHDTILYKLLKKLGFFKEVRNEKERYAKNRQRSRITKKKGKTFIWAFLSFFDSYFQYLISIIVFRKRLVIFDRFFYDFYVSFDYLNVKRANMFKNFLPKVKNKFLLICKPEIAFKRKPENTQDFFKYTNKTFLRLASAYSIKVIDTSRENPNKVLEKFISELKDV